MKKLYTPLVLFAFFCLSSCVDIEEHYDFKADGTCNVTYGFDMSKALSILTNLVSDSVRSTPQFSLVKDTTMNYYSTLADSVVKKMTPGEINTAKNSTLHINMDLTRNKMKINLEYLAKTQADLVYYLQHVSAFSMKVPPAEFADPNKKITSQKAGSDDWKGELLLSGQDYYTYEITDRKFSRTINKNKFNNFFKSAASRLAMAKAMLIDMPYKLVLKFARPVKKIDNSKALLSADRKQVTLITTMDEVMKNPALMNLKVDF
ncbi:hypothetical protein [Mucilaginibacter phyllosphaerae]|uniref:Uncharacterized protein n=1 Tax=Mucilaginibacter phyllosphaerae TaxID=1812349 RepID=A0A4Y8AB88_9SPHI|nr:hypothetical protein [Mucilaginibacter phyllosphaerae]MBB3969359.1 hypothetical protein [Mucilaginibacter phyllosphaerae]TEW65851.1 hypothetical protein E2R65_11995 [Mucilaginibacter phyllosphaerae]GGH07937.1 hypothetical protein GCM10007352_12890 [Mucilaginibacter phyllosphaerae]